MDIEIIELDDGSDFESFDLRSSTGEHLGDTETCQSAVDMAHEMAPHIGARRIIINLVPEKV